MCIRGVFIKFKKHTRYLVKSTIAPLNYQKAFWKIDEAEAFLKNLENIKIDGVFSNEKLEKALNINTAIVFIRLIRWPEGTEFFPSLDTYQDFKVNSCDIAILCTDMYYYEVYCKSKKDCVKMYNNYKENKNVEKLEYITNENDGRYTFHVDR